MNTETKVGTFVIVCLLLLGVTVYYMSSVPWRSSTRFRYGSRFAILWQTVYHRMPRTRRRSASQR